MRRADRLRREAVERDRPHAQPAADVSSIQAQIFEASDSPGRAAMRGVSHARQAFGGFILDLRTSVAYNNLVNVPSRGKAGATLVIPGDPDNSYLIQKLEGRSDIAGSRMPLNGPPYLTDGPDPGDPPLDSAGREQQLKERLRDPFTSPCRAHRPRCRARRRRTAGRGPRRSPDATATARSSAADVAAAGLETPSTDGSRQGAIDRRRTPTRRPPRRVSRPPPPATRSGAAQAKERDDAVLDRAQPDFTIVNLPTTLRLPKYKSAFRVTHRFTRPLGQGDFGNLLEDFFGFDSGALIGLEYRFGIMTGAQVGILRTSDRDDPVLRAVQREDAVGVVPGRSGRAREHRRHQQLPRQLFAGDRAGRVAHDRHARRRHTSSRSG